MAEYFQIHTNYQIVVSCGNWAFMMQRRSGKKDYWAVIATWKQ